MRRSLLVVVLWALAAGGAWALPKDDPRRPPPITCQPVWHASSCAAETYQVPTWTEDFSVHADANEKRYAFLFGGANEPPFDLAITAGLRAVDGAAGSVIDVDRFLGVLERTRPELYTELNADLFACVLIAFGLMDGSCEELISGSLSKVDLETIKASSLWWQGCWRSDSVVSREFPGVRAARYVVAAAANGGSSSDVRVSVTHHLPRPVTEPSCTWSSGPMPASGTYTHQRVGAAPATPQPRHGGTLASPTTRVTSRMARGTFSIEDGSVYFTGTVAPNLCDELP